MIQIDKDKIFNIDFINSYKQRIEKFITAKNLGFCFFHHSFSAHEIASGELVKCIAFNPFTPSGLNSKNDDFLKDYYRVSTFLLHSKEYLDIIKKQFDNKTGSAYRSKLLENRSSIIKKFKDNNILQSLGINNHENIKSEQGYLLFHKKVKTIFEKNNAQISVIFDYNDFLRSEDNIRNKILENIKITVCPYCNRQYIDTYSYGGDIRSIAQIDHLFPKSIFPLYALSLLNFVPSCSYCNCIIKKDKLFPWEKIYVDNASNPDYFSLVYTNIRGMFGDKDGFELKISPSRKESIDNGLFFRHNEIYANHKEDVSSILKKRLLLNEGYKKSVENTLSQKLTDDEFKLLLLGVKGCDEDLLTIPLSKLKNDILKSP